MSIESESEGETKVSSKGERRAESKRGRRNEARVGKVWMRFSDDGDNASECWESEERREGVT